MANTEILLESGTNEIEIMEFTINGELYGINVAKVREIMMSEKVKKVPQVHPAVEGIFKPRDILLTVVDLPQYLTGEAREKAEKDLFIVTNFNKMHIAFRVNSVEGIYRLSWKDIQKPDNTISRGDESVVTGIAQCNKELVTILDFEKIVADITLEVGITPEEIEKLGKRRESQCPIIFAEDSVLLSKIIEDSLKKAGYINLRRFNNGQEAWDFLSAIDNEEEMNEKVGLIITDIEMPQMDGHRLTKLVKTDVLLKSIPLIIFSSLINPEMEIKGKRLGADEQLSKPEIKHLVEVIDDLLEGRGTDG
jgi:two-component system, chemotaxis family, chemotaxis protein CheV